jgi:hypothetical protein
VVTRINACRRVANFLRAVSTGDMRASVGDLLHVHGAVVGRSERTGEIVEVRGSDGAPPYLVRYTDGHEGLVFPGPDSVVEPCGGDTAQDSPPNG